MDPVAIALAALVLVGTKATETVGEKLGEGTLAAAQRLWALLQRKAPETARRLAAADNPEVIDAEVIEDVRRAAEDPEVAAAVAATAAAAQVNGVDLQNLTKLADKIGVVNLAPVDTQNNTINI